jgi:hypothetical protein
LLTPGHHVKVLPGKNVGVHMAFISSEAAAAKQHEIAIIGSGRRCCTTSWPVLA